MDWRMSRNSLSGFLGRKLRRLSIMARATGAGHLFNVVLALSTIPEHSSLDPRLGN